MEVVANNFMPGDTRLVEQLVYELKSQGIFDRFRKECISDVDTKPAYQNLRQRVEGSVSTFLKQQVWSPDMNKNQVREQLRKNIYESGYLEAGVERIVDQVVNPKINTIFLPEVEDVVYRYLGIAKPVRDIKKEVKINITDLLPTDLEAVSPDSVQSFKEDIKPEDQNETLNDSLNSGSKPDDDESPPFEPLDPANKNNHEENSVDSHLSGFSGLQSHGSNHSSDIKVCQMEISSQDSQVSHNSSESRLSIITSEDATKMDICDDSSSNLMKSTTSKPTVVNMDVDEIMPCVGNDQGHNADIEMKESQIEDLKGEKDKSGDKKTDKTDDRKSDRKNDKTAEKKSRSSDKYSKDKHKKSSSKDGSSSRYSSSKENSSRSKEKDRTRSESKSSSSTRDKEKSDKNRDKSDKEKKDKDKEKTSRDKDTEKTDKEKSGQEKEKLDKPKERTDKDKAKTDKSSRDKDKSNKEKSDKSKQDKERERDKSEKDKSHREKEKSSKDKDKADKPKEKSDKEKSDKYKEKSGEKDKTDRERSRNSESKSGKDKKDRPSSSSSSKRDHSDKDKSRSSTSSSSKDRSKGDNGDSKSKSSSDKSRKESKTSVNGKSSGASSDSKKDKEKKRETKKQSKTDDDHYGAKDKKNDRRSTDRDSNDGRAGKQASFSGSVSENNSSRSEKSGQDFTTSGSGDSGNSDRVEPFESEVTAAVFSDIQRLIKPKFASNFQEARKIMKIRKQLAMLEKQQRLGFTQIESQVLVENGLPAKAKPKKPATKKKPARQTSAYERRQVAGKENVAAKSVVVAALPGDSPEPSYAEEVVLDTEIVTEETDSPWDAASLKSTELSKENWEALEARLAQEMATVDCNSYEYGDECPSPNKRPKLFETAAAETNVEEPVVEDAQDSDQSGDFKGFADGTDVSGSLEFFRSFISENTETKEEVKTLTVVLNKKEMETNTAEALNCSLTDTDECLYLEPPTLAEEENLRFLHEFVEKLEEELRDCTEASKNEAQPSQQQRRGRKRKLDENVDLRNNNKAHYEQATVRKKGRPPGSHTVIVKVSKEKTCSNTDLLSTERFSLPLSPAESDKSTDKKEEELLIPPKRRRIIAAQRYSSEDLYKPRPVFCRRNKDARKS